MHSHYADGSFRLWGKHHQWLDLAKGWGLSCHIEFPSEWHEDGAGTLHFCFIWGQVYIHFPWFKKYLDHCQCSGPKFGFSFFEDLLFLYHGNATSRSNDGSHTSIYMPWHWKHIEHAKTGETKTHDYTYQLKSGEVQHRKATITPEYRIWKRNWFPRYKLVRAIDVRFDDEVGERTGSWKGGTLGCGYEMQENEPALECLRRMERERQF